MKVSIVSFSYPRGVPDDPDDDYWGGFVFDCRSLPDPHGIAALKGLSGLDKPVIDFFERHKALVDHFLDATEALVRQSIEMYLKNGRDYLQVAFGCRGGHHRSVYMAERFAERLAGTPGIEIEVTHTARQYWTICQARNLIQMNVKSDNRVSSANVGKVPYIGKSPKKRKCWRPPRKGTK